MGGRSVVWSEWVRYYRQRHGMSQALLAAAMGVSQRTVSRWERGEDSPSLRQQQRFRDIGWQPPGQILQALAASIAHSPVPRALTRTQSLRLQVLSPPALEKRPSMADWIGRDLIDIASGVLAEMLDDEPLQRAIARREVRGVLATTRSVLQTPEAPRISVHRTLITYFFHEGTLLSDALSYPATGEGSCGYTVLPMDGSLDEGGAASTRRQ